MTYEEAQHLAQIVTGETASYIRRRGWIGGWIVELTPRADFEACTALESWFEANFPDGPPVTP